MKQFALGPLQVNTDCSKQRRGFENSPRPLLSECRNEAVGWEIRPDALMWLDVMSCSEFCRLFDAQRVQLHA